MHSSKIAYYESLHKKKEALKSSQIENAKLLTIVPGASQIEQ